MKDEDEEFAHLRFQDQHIVFTKYPARKNQDIKDIMEKYHYPGFLLVLTQFINSFNDNTLAGGHLRQASLPSAYPLETWCIPPFKKPCNRRLAMDQKTFNYHLSKISLYFSASVKFILIFKYLIVSLVH